MSRYGWKPELPNFRDYPFHEYALSRAVALPPKIDLRKFDTPIYDQGQLGSCTANAIAAAIDFERQQHGQPLIYPSRLFIYYGERKMEGTIPFDSGAEIRDGIKVVAKNGAPPEVAWPYATSRFAEEPSGDAYTAALADCVRAYSRLTSTKITELKSCLAVGAPFVFGFTVYPEFESEAVADKGFLPMPSGKQEPVGGHAVMCVGYDDETRLFIVRNSWGISWGASGYFYMPYDYMTNLNLADDFWHISTVGYSPQQGV